MKATTPPTVQTTSETRIFPIPRFLTPTTKDLSITDSAVAAISGPEAIWFYDAPSVAGILSSPLTLTKSLQKTLVSYPFLAGSLEAIPFLPGGNWTKRYGRLRAVYGQESDPGIQLVIATCDQELASVVPKNDQRGRIWESGFVPWGLFAGENIHMALHDGVELGNLSLMRVKLTTFACGGISVGVKIVHPIADTETLLNFMHNWSTIHHELIGNGSFVKCVSPVLEPGLLMDIAAGDIDSVCPDEDLKESAYKLPVHRFDWWASANGCPPPFLWRTQCAPEVQSSGVDIPPLGTPIPWEDWDMICPVSHYNIQFSPREIENMHTAALISRRDTDHPLGLSRLDALLSHIWGLIIQARHLPADDEVYFNMVLSFRSRVSPSLPKGFVGTPAILSYAKSTVSSAVGLDSLPILARAIRTSISSFSPSTIPSFLHNAAYQIDPKRYWQTFIGRHHVTATAWLHHGVNKVDFGWGRPRHVEPIMPGYMMCITEADTSGVAAKGEVEHELWHAGGANVSIHFETVVMDRLLQNPRLRAFDY